MVVESDLPDFLAKLLARLADQLPPPVYSLLLSLAYRSLAFLSPFLSLIPPLPSSQNIVSPLITLLCAYLALLTLYRTTAWAVRTMLWFFKWGIILSVLCTGLGWYLGSADPNLGVIANFKDTIVRTVLESANAHAGEAAGGTNGPRQPRPWDSYESHRRWRERGQQGTANELDPKNMIKTVADIAGGFLEQGEQWWTAAYGESARQPANRQRSKRNKHQSR